MSGKELKDKLEATGISKATIAEKLGITPQHQNQQLNVDDVKSGFLERVCKALNWTMGQLYGDTVVSVPLDVKELIDENKYLRAKVDGMVEMAKAFGFNVPTPEQKRNVG